MIKKAIFLLVARMLDTGTSIPVRINMKNLIGELFFINVFYQLYRCPRRRHDRKESPSK